MTRMSDADSNRFTRKKNTPAHNQSPCRSRGKDARCHCSTGALSLVWEVIRVHEVLRGDRF